MNLDFTGKVAVVTGGAMGIGEATARKLAAHGASVAILDVDRDAGPNTAASINRNGGICGRAPAPCREEHLFRSNCFIGARGVFGAETNSLRKRAMVPYLSVPSVPAPFTSHWPQLLGELCFNRKGMSNTKVG